MIVDAFLASFNEGSPDRLGAAKKAAAMLQTFGRVNDDTRLIAAWRRGAVPVPADAQAIMRLRIIARWPGQFDRLGLLDALELPVRTEASYPRRKKPVASSVQQI